MEFALLGTHKDASPFLNSVDAQPRHRLVAYWTDPESECNLAPSQTSLSSAAAQIHLSAATVKLANPDQVLNLKSLSALLLSATDSASLEVARQCVSNNTPLVIWPRAEHGIEFVYQLGLIRDEQPDQFHLVVLSAIQADQIQKKLDEVRLTYGLRNVIQVQCTRRLRSSELPQDALVNSLSHSDVRNAFLKDIQVLWTVAGPFQQIAALEVGGSETGILQTTVNLTSTQGTPVTWNCLPSAPDRSTNDRLDSLREPTLDQGANRDNPPSNRSTDPNETQWELVARCEAGEIYFSGNVLKQSLRVLSPQGTSLLEECQALDTGDIQLRQVERELQDIPIQRSSGTPVSQSFQELLHQFDLLEGFERSLRRRRAVDLYFDIPSERSNFKSQMAAAGCLILILTLFALPIGLMGGAIAKELGLPLVLMQIIRVAVFLPLFLFLFLQLGIFLAKPSADGTSPPGK